MKKIKVIKKEPGKAPEEVEIGRDLESLQAAVGGYIEAVQFARGVDCICIEEGRLLGLPYNCSFYGTHFCGTVLIVGVKGQEFASIPDLAKKAVMDLLKTGVS